MEKNKTGKYFKYAIGEIILVVIGILIALQINNWNTQRLQDANALRLSKRLVAETERNITNFNAQLLRTKGSKESALTILQLITEDYTTLDEHVIDSLIYNAYSSPNVQFNSAVLNEALSTGEVSKFKNDSLKNLIYSLPSEITRVRLDEENMRQINDSFGEMLYDNYSLRKMDYKFSSTGKLLGKSKLPEIDNRKIVSSQRFENLVDEQYYQLNSMLDKYNSTLDKLTTILELLKQKINSE